ncbi:outer membrane protein assembly factor BamE [Bartonella sp. HY328]|uniref:outer membrane protein assembly factor BamE n=1 Tax=unclassified Bartonella TaxID=2645622 RepID=UPI003965CAB7
MSLSRINFARKRFKNGITIALLAGVAFATTACNSTDLLKTSQTFVEGYVVDQDALDSIPVGSSRDQVLLALGTPSTTAIFDNEVFYYISQTRYRGAQFMKAKIVDRKILAIYFDNKGIVKKIANYGLQDGRLFDFASNTTPTGGRDQSFLNQLIVGSSAAPAGLPTTGR